MVLLLCPGLVDTEMTAGFEHPDKISADESANRIFQRMKELTIETTGSFLNNKGETIAW